MHPPTFSHCPSTGRSLTAGRALVGRVIADRYRVLALIGEGGMGAVYVAEHLAIGRKVAIKRLHPELAGDERAVARFQREARAAAATGHEHIVEVLDLGYAEDGAPFLVMEYLRGRSLSAVIDADAPLAPERACRILGQVLAALEEVHRRGIVHRDLKPDNVILTHRRGDPDFAKILDFGISKMRSEEGDKPLDLTRTGVMLGTPFYMSPEQARGIRSLDQRVDLFAAGVILYQALTGRLPFDGDNYHQLLQAILSGKHPPVGSLRPDLHEGLAAAVERAIANDRDERYETARDMLLALVPHGAVDPGRTRPDERPSASAGGWPSTPTPGSRTTPMTDPLPAPSPATDPTEPSLTPVRQVTPRRATGARAARHPRGLAPNPGTLAATPRRFVAQSADWRPPGSAPKASGAREDASAYVPSRPDRPLAVATSGFVSPKSGVTRRAPKRVAPTPASATQVKASLVLCALDEIGRRGPDARDEVIARLPTGVAVLFEGVLLPMAWLDLAHYVELLRAAERTLGRGEDAIAIAIGRATADRELPTTHRHFMQSATPQMALERIPHIFRLYHSSGQVTVRNATAGGYRVATEGILPDALPHALVFSGFYQRMIELVGGRDVRAAVVSCRERGDASTVIVLRWR